MEDYNLCSVCVLMGGYNLIFVWFQTNMNQSRVLTYDQKMDVDNFRLYMCTNGWLQLDICMISDRHKSIKSAFL